MSSSLSSSLSSADVCHAQVCRSCHSEHNLAIGLHQGDCRLMARIQHRWGQQHYVGTTLNKLTHQSRHVGAVVRRRHPLHRIVDARANTDGCRQQRQHVAPEARQHLV